MKNLIGEYSNYATAYRNRCGKTEKQRNKYEKYIDIISVLTGKSINNRWPTLATVWCKVSEPTHVGCRPMTG